MRTRPFSGPAKARRCGGCCASRQVRIVSSTVTEKGYCLAGDGTLDFAHPDIVHDLARPRTPLSLVGWLALGLADRRDCRPAALHLAVLRQYGRRTAASFARRWSHLRAGSIRSSPTGSPAKRVFPDTMVDSITPATDDAPEGDGARGNRL